MTKETDVVPYEAPPFQYGDTVQFGEGWAFTGKIIKVVRTGEDPSKFKYVVKYWIGRSSRFKDFNPEELKLRFRNVK